ncbi:MAG TPA: TPM domain-containing protein [Candidatus Marinimicrobia bacterium]|nr:TPM domain-containing protein [Candidatus Neomarinimicrobiota bacterium]
MALIDKYFSKDDLQQITVACGEAEKQTAGEIRVSIFSKRPRKLREKSLEEMALDEFFRLGMDKTRDQTGILLLIILAERKFQILADRGINAKVDQPTWDELADTLSEYFKNGKYLEGVQHCVRRMGAILAQHFPIKSDDTNELSNEVSVQ